MKKQLLLLFFLMLSSISMAQTVGGSFMLGYPQGDFRTNVDQMGYGFQVHGTFWEPTPERPFTIGLDLGYTIYGHQSERREWPGFPGIFLDLTRTNSVGSLHLLMQVSPFFGTVRPYVEGLFGGSYIWTSSEVKSENSVQQIASTTNYDDFTWNYGGGVGILFKLTDNLEKVSVLYLDLKARYLFGTEASYLTENSIFVNSLGQTIYSARKSKTDFFTFHVGVVAYLDL
jgi:hypothetical protein